MKFQTIKSDIGVGPSAALPVSVGGLEFDKPVVILIGLGLPRSINTVADAFEVLNEWPFTSRNAAHQLALNACKAALSGDIEVDTARTMLVAFARKAGIFAPQFTDLIAHKAKGGGGAGSSTQH